MQVVSKKVSIFGEILAMAALVAGPANGQLKQRQPATDGTTLNRHAQVTEEGILKVYNSSEYKEAFEQAEKKSAQLKIETSWIPESYNPHAQTVWRRTTSDQIIQFADRTKALKMQFGIISQSDGVQNNPVKLAQIDQIDYRFSRDMISDLNDFVDSLKSGPVCKESRTPDPYPLLSKRPIPSNLNSSNDFNGHFEGNLITDYIFDVQNCLYNAKPHPVTFKTTSFASYNDLPTDSTGKLLNNREACFVWQEQYAKLIFDLEVRLNANFQRANMMLIIQGFPQINRSLQPSIRVAVNANGKRVVINNILVDMEGSSPAEKATLMKTFKLEKLPNP